MTNHPNRSKHTMTEQQATHTPGPWHISPCYFGGFLNHIEINGETDGIAVTKCEANARLIAAAPELLAALEDFVALDQASPRSKDGERAFVAVRDLEVFLSRARAAIAKCEGR